MLNLNSIMIGTKQTKALAAFYEKVLGKPPEMTDPENGFFGWQVGASYFGVLEHSEMGGNTKDPGRIMLNFETSPGESRNLNGSNHWEGLSYRHHTRWVVDGLPPWLTLMATTFS